ncbi:23S rRNA (pseudouridine(1915)-N(3))-methyltransferase RlmH [Patescibacteria group bacterium]|nr:23S rRNA (pseudouridine(1915)-N(3))-methyltransferase RlmH [Patescibacteria group bacterium]MBU1907414.1 23S rRNA (pseudouridine(1915)-N(3))-methyltransferase RlmH [Patescibacteria group bacterium]
MIKITIITVSKLKSGAWKELADEYLKRLKPYAKVEVIEVAETKFKSEADRNKVQKSEADRIEKAIPKDAFRICLDERGSELTSQSFAARLDEWSMNGQLELAFVIGGPLGLHPRVCSTDTDVTLALSKFTLPHDEARVVLLEQIYRAFTILKNKTYHY